MPVIEVTDLYKQYGKTKAVDGISFAVEKGEIFGMLGPNGAGKTTTIEIIEGLRSYEKGGVRLLDFEVRKNHDDVKETIGVQLQASSMPDRLTIRETLSLFSSFYQHTVDIDDLLLDLNLEEKSRALTRNLSGGQKQRLAIALALVNDPLVVFLDEPTTGLDPQARRSLWEVIRRIRQTGKTVLLTTHYMEEAEQLCDRVAIMDRGKILALDTPQAMINTYFKEKTVEVELEAGALEGVDWRSRLPHVESFHQDGSHLILYTDDSQSLIRDLFDQSDRESWTFSDLRVRSATLEDVFLQLTGNRLRE